MFLAGPRGHLGDLKAQDEGLEGDFVCPWRPSWSHVGDLGGNFGDSSSLCWTKLAVETENVDFVSVLARFCGGMLGSSWSMFGHLGVILGHLEANLRLS